MGRSKGRQIRFHKGASYLRGGSDVGCDISHVGENSVAVVFTLEFLPFPLTSQDFEYEHSILLDSVYALYHLSQGHGMCNAC